MTRKKTDREARERKKEKQRHEERVRHSKKRKKRDASRIMKTTKTSTSTICKRMDVVNKPTKGGSVSSS